MFSFSRYFNGVLAPILSKKQNEHLKLGFVIDFKDRLLEL